MTPQKDENLSPENLLREFEMILALEEKAAQTYHQLATDCDDAEARNLLFAISRQENAHVEIAKNLVHLASEWVQKNRGNA